MRAFYSLVALLSLIFIGALGCDIGGGSSGAAKDSDGDGIEDVSDNCPDTPALESVDDFGCSEGQNAADSDSDGVNDPADDCPETPAGDAVDANGCSVTQAQSDADGDGIADLDDNCPSDPNSDQADEDGDGIGRACEEFVAYFGTYACDTGCGFGDPIQLGESANSNNVRMQGLQGNGGALEFAVDANAGQATSERSDVTLFGSASHTIRLTYRTSDMLFEGEVTNSPSTNCSAVCTCESGCP